MCVQAMFSLCMLESEADEVTLQGVTSVGLKHALDFAYTGQVSHEQHRRNKSRGCAGALLMGRAAVTRPHVAGVTFIRVCGVVSCAA